VITGRGGGGDEGNRTPNPCLAKAVLCQLSYVPEGKSDLSGRLRSGAGRLLPDVAAGLALLPLQCVLDPCGRGYESEQLLHGVPLCGRACSNRAVLLTRSRVGLGGLEPPASSLSGMRSNHLSYRPVACRTCVSDTRELSLPVAIPQAQPARLLPFGERHLNATDQVRAQVVNHRPDGAHRDEQHDVDRADEERTAEHQ
jgi:hypothetical protein